MGGWFRPLPRGTCQARVVGGALKMMAGGEGRENICKKNLMIEECIKKMRKLVLNFFFIYIINKMEWKYKDKKIKIKVRK